MLHKIVWIVCLIIVIKSSCGNNSGPLHIYQANTFPIIVTHAHVIQLIDVADLYAIPKTVLDGGGRSLGGGWGSLCSTIVDGATISPTRPLLRNSVHARNTNIIKKLSRAWPLFKIIEMFSTCVGRLRCISTRLGTDVTSI